MSKAFYFKMAAANISKNRKIYIPYILMGAFITTMIYIMASLLFNSSVDKNVKFMLTIGAYVTGFFGIIFLFYINSFVMKRRKKEIGLYNILGMEKRHIARMMFFEIIYVTLFVLLSGLLFGIIFSKLVFLLLAKLMQLSPEKLPPFEIPAGAVVTTLIVMGATYFVTLLYNLAKIHLTKPIELLHGGHIGEKEPKTKIIMALIGFVCLGAGYFFALTTQSPFAAISKFLLAVVLVIVGTYFVFTAGSIVIIKMLRKNKNYYYKTAHFTNVSGMLYRMKQNAVGLANICILSTMVLISVSTTVCMYAGMENTVTSSYPSEINVDATMYENNDVQILKNQVDDICRKYGAEQKNVTSGSNYTVYGSKTDYGMEVITNTELMNTEKLTGMIMVSLDEYNEVAGKDYTLGDNEILFHSSNKKNLTDYKVTFGDDSVDFKIKEKLDTVPEALGSSAIESIIDANLVVVKDKKTLESVAGKIDDFMRQNGKIVGGITNYYCFDTNLSKDESIKLNNEINKIDIDGMTIFSNDQYEMRDEFHMTYGSLLFIGIFVGIVFLMATVLIVYYKQISEGYEDKERFEIMQKVGMSQEEVKKTIRSQVLMVFFIPLIAAAIHVAVAFRIVKKILAIMSLGGSTGMFLLCTVISLAAFSVIYAIVFSITAKSYYKIVKA